MPTRLEESEESATRRTGGQTGTCERVDQKADDMLVVYRTVAERVLSQMRPMAGGGARSATARVALEPLVSVLQSDPDAGPILFVKGRAGGQRIGEERERVLEEFERLVQAFLDSAPKEDGSTLDIPATAVVGALRSIVSRHLRTHAEDRLPLALEDALAWVESYATRGRGERFSTGPRALLEGAPADQGPLAQRPTRGRYRLPPGVVAPSQRERIIYAIAEVMMAKGYAKATVADIVAQAGVARRSSMSTSPTSNTHSWRLNSTPRSTFSTPAQRHT